MKDDEVLGSLNLTMCQSLLLFSWPFFEKDMPSFGKPIFQYQAKTNQKTDTFSSCSCFLDESFWRIWNANGLSCFHFHAPVEANSNCYHFSVISCPCARWFCSSTFECEQWKACLYSTSACDLLYNFSDQHCPFYLCLILLSPSPFTATFLPPCH